MRYINLRLTYLLTYFPPRGVAMGWTGATCTPTGVNESFEWKKVTFYGVKTTYSDPSYIYSGGQDPLNPMFYAPGCVQNGLLENIYRRIAHMTRDVGLR